MRKYVHLTNDGEYTLCGRRVTGRRINLNLPDCPKCSLSAGHLPMVRARINEQLWQEMVREVMKGKND